MRFGITDNLGPIRGSDASSKPLRSTRHSKPASDQRLIDEALASGPEEPLTRSKMDQIRDRILQPKHLR